MFEAPFGDTLHDLGQALEGRQAVHEAVARDDVFLAGDLHEGHCLRVARLEAHGGARGDVEAEAVGLRTVELQRLVRLDKVVVRADLDGPVASVCDPELDQLPARVQLDAITLSHHDLAGRGLVLGDLAEGRQIGLGQERALEGQGEVAVEGGDRLMHRQKLGAVGEGCFDLHLRNQLRHARHDLPPAQELLADVHEVNHGLTIADKLHHLA
mmetsp:Transcript_95716/g.270348  ORF Transcript_95716/g.270348 Transcript_95716/m.270348 type:complete len:212 (-) Transcript_95716:274-909(-)